MKTLLWAACAMVLCGSCSSQMQRSAPMSPYYLAANPLTKESKKGLPYFLPDTVVPITISGDFVVLPERNPGTKDWKPTPADQEYVITVTIGEPKQVADPNAALMLEYVPESFSDDTFRLSIGANGLLGNVKSTSDDKTGAVILKLAELAKEVAKTTVYLAKGIVKTADDATLGDSRRQQCFNKLQKMSVTTQVNLSDVLRIEAAAAFVARAVRSNPQWDYSGVPESERDMADQYARYLWSLEQPNMPFSLDAMMVAPGMPGKLFSGNDRISKNQVAQLNSNAVRAMQKSPEGTSEGGPVEAFSLVAKPKFPTPGTEFYEYPRTKPDAKTYSGVVFRMMTPRSLSIKLNSQSLKFGECVLRNVATYSDGNVVMVANPTSTFVADNSRGAFVKKRVDFLVTDGVLTGIEVDKPSELLAILSTPVSVLKEIASIPGELLTIRIKQLTDEKSLTSAQADVLKAQIELMKQWRARIDEQNNASGTNP